MAVFLYYSISSRIYVTSGELERSQSFIYQAYMYVDLVTHCVWAFQFTFVSLYLAVV